MYKEDDYLLLSGIQHFSFCRRQWALIHVEQQWADNYLTAEGQVQHIRTHDFKKRDNRNGVITFHGMKIHSAELGIVGECDAVEFAPTKNGIRIRGLNGEWSVMPVEYKHGREKISDCDRLQVVAQTMCLEEMMSCQISKAALFYFEVFKREYIDITSDLRNEVKKVTHEMHSYMSRGYTPKAKYNKHCRSCSLAEICIPKLLKEKDTVSTYIEQHLEELANADNT